MKGQQRQGTAMLGRDRWGTAMRSDTMMGGRETSQGMSTRMDSITSSGLANLEENPSAIK